MGHSADGRRHVTTDPLTADDHSCTILHVDIDAFFAAVELRRHPELRGRPMMVAGDRSRGVVLSATYEARRYGIRSAMPTLAATALCPGIAIVPPDHSAYRRASRQVMEIFAEVTPLVEPVSVDEAFLDVSGAGRSAGRPAAIAVELRRRIAARLDLTATVGAASSKFVAKLASSLAKPDGMLVVPPQDVRELLDPLPTRALWGVGPKTATVLESLGLTTIGDIASTDRAVLIRAVGTAAGTKLHDLANGLDDRAVVTDTAEGSIGAEHTFAVDISDRRRLGLELLALSDRTVRRARIAGLSGRTVALKIRFSDFTTISRSVTLDTPTDLAGVVHRTAVTLLDRLALGGRRVRLVGVRLEGLVQTDQVTEQLQLTDGSRGAGWREAEGALDRVMARFGSTAVRRASLLHDRNGPDLPSSGRESSVR